MLPKIILCSQSPRRKELLTGAGFDFETYIPDVEEVFDDNMSVLDVPEYLAVLKYNAIPNDIKKNRIIITADTVVVLENGIIGKPKDLEDAKHILARLSGKKHQVITGVVVAYEDRIHQFSDITDVYFYEITPTEIDFFVEKYKPLDKAGAYAIQEWIGYIGVKKIEGCFYNVMGLPIPRVYQMLKQFQ